MEKLIIIQRPAVTPTGIAVVALEGVLDINNAESLETVLRGLVIKKQYRIVLNLQKLTYLSSAGIGVLLNSIKEVRINGGDIKVSNTPPDIFKVFEIIELPAIVQILKTEQEAISGF